MHRHGSQQTLKQEGMLHSVEFQLQVMERKAARRQAKQTQESLIDSRMILGAP